ncbi:putative reverse transcriptase zinc-binding domain-containing protein [Helianthus debilis subsp. tardiflorus]
MEAINITMLVQWLRFGWPKGEMSSTWIWGAENYELFFVKSVKRLLGASAQPNGFIRDWNSWVPSKVNLFGWRSKMEIVPTLLALLRRYIIVPSTDCQFCGEDAKSMEHPLTSCYVATRVWKWVSVWCNIRSIICFSARDLLELHEHARLGKDKAKAVQPFILTTCWASKKQLGPFGKSCGDRYAQ